MHTKNMRFRMHYTIKNENFNTIQSYPIKIQLQI